ncbi:hypothetical protein CAC42_7851 [Sphaceloma murrayae]|uniref:NAD-dependent epimerase/dehydratase domain-containing protein n=1 Tax=Sphaceloma murrayae TaxID=2082308 RepID=A0A2K1QXV4_9PEZI|nr:hypothetical protein CAC42_7851 [Sphaceloma murrayae]
MAQQTKKLLLTGATGYMHVERGGTVLYDLLHSTIPKVQELDISILLRNASLTEYFEAQGATVIPFTSLDDTAHIRTIASAHDIVIHTASGLHTASAEALIRGLGDRKAETGAEVTYIHTSGCTNIGDRPLSLGFVDKSLHSDKDDVHTLLVEREKLFQWTQRQTDLVTVATGEEVGVRTYIIMVPQVFGFGKGVARINKLLSFWVDTQVERGRANYIGDGDGVWSMVDIADAAALYVLLLAKVLEGAPPASGKKGWFFLSATEMTLKEWARKQGDAGVQAGIFKETEPESVTVEELAKDNGWLAGFMEILASSARMRPDRARELGWGPVKGTNGWEEEWTDMFVELYKQKAAGSGK